MNLGSDHVGRDRKPGLVSGPTGHRPADVTIRRGTPQVAKNSCAVVPDRAGPKDAKLAFSRVEFPHGGLRVWNGYAGLGSGNHEVGFKLEAVHDVLASHP